MKLSLNSIPQSVFSVRACDTQDKTSERANLVA